LSVIIAAQKYINTVYVNGTSYTVYFNSGSANISISNATFVIQQLSIIYATASTTPTYIISSATPYTT
jgi:hypothetical protein